MEGEHRGLGWKNATVAANQRGKLALKRATPRNEKKKKSLMDQLANAWEEGLLFCASFLPPFSYIPCFLHVFYIPVYFLPTTAYA